MHTFILGVRGLGGLPLGAFYKVSIFAQPMRHVYARFEPQSGRRVAWAIGTPEVRNAVLDRAEGDGAMK